MVGWGVRGAGVRGVSGDSEWPWRQQGCRPVQARNGAAPPAADPTDCPHVLGCLLLPFNMRAAFDLVNRTHPRFLSEATSLTRLHLQWPGAPASRAPVLLLPAAAAAAGCYSPGRAAGSWSSAPPLFQAGSSPGAAAAAAGAGGWPAAAEPAVPVAAAAPADVKVANWSVYDAMAARRRYVGCLAALTELADVELDCPGACVCGSGWS